MRTLILKSAVWLAAALVVAMAVPACDAGAPGEYRNREKSFSVVFPPAWELGEDQFGLDVAALSPLEGPGDKYRDNVSIASSVMPTPLDADAILDHNLPSMMNVITDFKVLDRGQRTINGIDACWVDYKQTQGIFKLKVRLYALPGAGHAYLIYCIAEADAAERFEQQFQEIVGSFQPR